MAAQLAIVPVLKAIAPTVISRLMSRRSSEEEEEKEAPVEESPPENLTELYARKAQD